MTEVNEAGGPDDELAEVGHIAERNRPGMALCGQGLPEVHINVKRTRGSFCQFCSRIWDERGRPD